MEEQGQFTAGERKGNLTSRDAGVGFFFFCPLGVVTSWNMEFVRMGYFTLKAGRCNKDTDGDSSLRIIMLHIFSSQ